MGILSLKELSATKSENQKLKDISKNLLFSVALSSGLAHKEKVQSFYKIIAKELKELIDSGYLTKLSLYKFHNHYMRITTQNINVCYLKNNIFDKESKITSERFLEQKLVYLEEHEIPKFLPSKEKENLINSIDSDLESIIIRNYSRQELNSDRYLLTLNEADKDVLLRIFKKYNYYDINVHKYIEMMATDYNYNIETVFENKKLKNAYNNYILELGLYISKEIQNYLNK